MSYGRKTVMGGLRKAGQFLIEKDEQYAQKIRGGANENINSMPGPLGVLEGYRAMSSGTPLNQIYVDHGATNRSERAVSIGANTAMMLSNAGARYALPAGGVTLAGKGLMDIAASFGSPADEPEPNQLPLQ